MERLDCQYGPRGMVGALGTLSVEKYYIVAKENNLIKVLDHPYNSIEDAMSIVTENPRWKSVEIIPVSKWTELWNKRFWK